MLEERGGLRSSKGQGVTCGAGRSEDEEKQQEEEAGFTLVAVTKGMKDFINAMSSHQGAEFPRYHHHHRSLTLRGNRFLFIFTLVQSAVFSEEKKKSGYNIYIFKKFLLNISQICSDI